MSLFPQSYFAPEASFTPLFRLLDDFDNYSRGGAPQQATNRQGNRRALPSFSPRFDVKETETGYELHGELPGVEKDNIRIEFTEPQTIVISGRTERTYTSGTPPAGLVDGQSMSGAITDGNEKTDSAASASHKATVSDEDAEKAKEQGTELAKTAEPSKQQPPKEKVWVSERSVGEFSRTFSFPSPVDQEAVGANLKDGILTVTVPKAKKHEGKRITVS